MLMNMEQSQHLFKLLNMARKHHLKFDEADLLDLMYTTNELIILDKDVNIVDSAFSLTDYEVPDDWKFLIVPVDVKYTSEDESLSVIDEEYYKVNPITGAKLLSPTKYILLWEQVIGSYKSSNKNFTKVSELKKEAVVTALGMMKRMITRASKNVCMDAEWPIISKVVFYDKYTYNYPIDHYMEIRFGNVISQREKEKKDKE